MKPKGNRPLDFVKFKWKAHSHRCKYYWTFRVLYHLI